MNCYTCVIACKDWNDVPPGPAAWRKVITFEGGKYPNPFAARLSTSCYHCAEPACVYACPADAITKRESDGIVVVDQEKCRGRDHCGYAVMVDVPAEGRKSPCGYGCPAGVSARGYTRLIAKGMFKQALALIREQMPLPGVCGRVCSAPCEDVCKRQETGEKAVSIKGLKRFVADYVDEGTPSALPITKDKKVAIVGSGPAGLTVAYDLIRKGYAVTIFEALPVAGGMLAVGMPEYRLPKDVLKKEIDYLEALGIEIRRNTRIGNLKDLTDQGYGAVFLGIGAHGSPSLGIPGEDAEGIYSGVPFLRSVSMGEPVTIGQKVAVIGGGNVAVDAARTALRLGAKEVRLNCLESREEIPALAEEIESAIAEGITLSCSCGPQNILTENGKVTGIDFMLCTSVFDEDACFCPTFDEDTVTHLEADTIILAIGQKADTSGLPQELALTERGTIVTDPVTLATNIPGVFSGGDVVTGPARFVDAVAAGHEAAISIERYLEGADLTQGRFEERVDASQIKVEISDELEKCERHEMPELAASERTGSFTEVNLGFDEETAMAEANRCMICGGMLCGEVCQYDAPQWGPEHDEKMQKCNLCVDRWEEGKLPICVGACLTRAIDAGPIEEMEAKYGTKIHDAMGFTYTDRTKPSIVLKPANIKGVPTNILVSPHPDAPTDYDPTVSTSYELVDREKK